MKREQVARELAWENAPRNNEQVWQVANPLSFESTNNHMDPRPAEMILNLHSKRAPLNLQARFWSCFEATLDIFTVGVALMDMVSDFFVLWQWLNEGKTDWFIAGSVIMTLAGLAYIVLFISAVPWAESLADKWVGLPGNCAIGISGHKWMALRWSEFAVFTVLFASTTVCGLLILAVTVAPTLPFVLWMMNLRREANGQEMLVPTAFADLVTDLAAGEDSIFYVGELVILNTGLTGVVAEVKCLTADKPTRKNSMDHAINASLTVPRSLRNLNSDAYPSSLMYRVECADGSSSWVKPSDFERSHKSDSRALMQSIKQKISKHAMFLAESCFESVPQSLLQLAYLITYQKTSVLNVFSIALSILSVISKAYTSSFSFDIRLFVLRMGIASIDITSLYFITASVCKAIAHPPATQSLYYFWGLPTDLYTSIWLWITLVSYTWLWIFLIYLSMLLSNKYLSGMNNWDTNKSNSRWWHLLETVAIFCGFILFFLFVSIPAIVFLETAKLYLLLDPESYRENSDDDDMSGVYAAFSARILHFFRGGEWYKKLVHVHLAIVERSLEEVRGELSQEDLIKRVQCLRYNSPDILSKDEYDGLRSLTGCQHALTKWVGSVGPWSACCVCGINSHDIKAKHFHGCEFGCDYGICNSCAQPGLIAKPSFLPPTHTKKSGSLTTPTPGSSARSQDWLHLFVRDITGESFAVDVQPVSTMLQVKAVVEEIEGTPLHLQSFYLAEAEVELTNNSTVAEQKLTNGSEITLVRYEKQEGLGTTSPLSKPSLCSSALLSRAIFARVLKRLRKKYVEHKACLESNQNAKLPLVRLKDDVAFKCRMSDYGHYLEDHFPIFSRAEPFVAGCTVYLFLVKAFYTVLVYPVLIYSNGPFDLFQLVTFCRYGIVVYSPLVRY
jgi:hypothetical protein